MLICDGSKSKIPIWFLHFSNSYRLSLTWLTSIMTDYPLDYKHLVIMSITRLADPQSASSLWSPDRALTSQMTPGPRTGNCGKWRSEETKNSRVSLISIVTLWDSRHDMWLSDNSPHITRLWEVSQSSKVKVVTNNVNVTATTNRSVSASLAWLTGPAPLSLTNVSPQLSVSAQC